MEREDEGVARLPGAGAEAILTEARSLPEGLRALLHLLRRGLRLAGLGGRAAHPREIGERLSPPGLVCSRTGEHERGPIYTTLSSI